MKKSTVIEYFGGKRQVAEALGISREAVVMWPEIVPPLRQYELEDITGGKLVADRRPCLRLPAKRRREAA